MMKRLRLRSLLALALVLAMAVTAWAFYSTSGAGNGGGSIGTLTEPVLSQPSATGGSVPLSWTAATLPGNASLESQITYVVQRNVDAGGWGTAAAACTDVPTTSCTDTVSTSGSYAYRVVAKFRTWTATSTEKTVSVTVGGDTQAPDLTELEMFDTNDNGKVDQVKATFDEALETSTATAPWTLSNVPSGGDLSSVSTSGAVATLEIAEGAGAADTAVGSFTVALAADPAGIRDAAGNESSFAAKAPDDKAAPRVTAVNRTGSTPTNAASVGFSVDFSESVENVAAADFATAGTHTGASIQSTIGGSGASYTVTVTTGSGNGTLGLNLNDTDNSIEDVPGNPIEVNTFTGQTYTIDKTAPASSASSPQYANSSPITVTYTVTDTGGSGVKEVDLFVDTPAAGTNYVPAGTDTSPDSPSFAYTPSAGQGNYRFYTRARDNATNYEAIPGTLPDTSTLYDTVAPGSSASSTTATNSSPFTVTYTATDGGSGVDEVELWARKGSSGSFTLVTTDTDPTSAEFAFTPTGGDGTYEFYTRARDSAGNYEADPGAADDSTLYDTMGPTVTSIARTGSAGNPTDAASVQWLVTYSESVTGVDANDFELSTTGVTGASITGVTGTGATRTVTASTGSRPGTIGLAALDNDTIVDGVGNNLQAGLAEDAAWRYTIDKPSVVSINRSSGENPTNDATVTWTVTFSEPVSNVDSADFNRVLTDVTGGSFGAINPVGGPAPATSWTVVVNTGSGSGSIGLNLVDNDTITDGAGRRLGGVGNGNGDFTGEVFTIDKTGPQLDSLEMFETGTPDGRIDEVVATFDDELDESVGTATTGWSLDFAPGGVTPSSVDVDGMTATLNLTGGTAGSASTTTVQGNRNFTVRLDGATGLIRDALGNTAAFEQVPIDKAGPVPFDFTDDDTATGGGGAANNGLFQTNDVLTVSFTEPLASYDTTTNGPDAIVRNGTPAATGNDDVSLPGTLDNSFRTLNRTDYLASATAGIQATFPGASASRPTANNDRHKIEIKLGGTACTPTANCTFTKAGAASNYTYLPDSAITDQSPAANAAVGSFTKSSLLF